MPSDFDPNETIGGYPLTKIKVALSLLCGMKRDVGHFSKKLRCTMPEARTVLVELADRGYVERLPGRPARWKTSARGWHLVFEWQPPRRRRPARSREDRPGSISQICGYVRCELLGGDMGDEHFTEAVLEPAMCVDYVTDRVIELNVLEPDDYDDKESGGTIKTIACVTIEEARELIDGLVMAIAFAEVEATKTNRRPRKRAQRGRVESG